MHLTLSGAIVTQAGAGEPKLHAMVRLHAATLQRKLQDARTKVKRLSRKIKQLQTAHGKMKKKLDDARLAEAALRQANRQEAAAEPSKRKPIKNVTKTLKKLPRPLVPKKLRANSFLTVDVRGVVHAIVQPNIEYLPNPAYNGFVYNGYIRWP